MRIINLLIWTMDDIPSFTSIHKSYFSYSCLLRQVIYRLFPCRLWPNKDPKAADDIVTIEKNTTISYETEEENSGLHHITLLLHLCNKTLTTTSQVNLGMKDVDQKARVVRLGSKPCHAKSFPMYNTQCIRRSIILGCTYNSLVASPYRPGITCMCISR
jgi:hypothetical protein